MSAKNNVSTNFEDVVDYLQDAFISASNTSEALEDVKRRLKDAVDAEDERQRKIQQITKEILKVDADLLSLEKNAKTVSFECDGSKRAKEISERNKRPARFGYNVQEVVIPNVEQIIALKKEIPIRRELLAEVIKKQLEGLMRLCNMYRQVTNIEWCTSTEPHDCQGYIALKDNTVPFVEPNVSQASAYFIANHIWTLMDEYENKDFS